MDEKKTIFSYAFVVYLVYVLYIWGTDVVDCFCCLIGLQQTTLISRIIVGAVLLVVVWRFFKYIQVERAGMNVKLGIGLLILIVIGIVKSTYPDTSTDTLSYHLIAQHPGFTNYFEEHFAKGNVQVWGFRLGDRMFYALRYLLGYRWGTLLNTMVLCISYFQINHLLNYCFTVRGNEEIKKNYVAAFMSCSELWALLIVLIPHSVYMYGMYMVDILSVPVILEALRVLIEASRKKVKTSDILYFAFLMGFCFAFKMTNIVYVVPFCVIYIILVAKQLNVRNFIGSAVLVAVPCLVYLLYSFHETGNPVFPYYNNIFQSAYFPAMHYDFNEGNVEKNIIEKILWIFYTVIFPGSRQIGLTSPYNLILGVGLISLILASICIVIGKCVKREIVNNRVAILTALVWFTAVIWGITTGHARYYILGMYLIGMLAYSLFVGVLSLDKVVLKGKASVINFVFCVTGSVVLTGMIVEAGLTVKSDMEGREWAWRKFSIATFGEQFSQVLKDKQFRTADENMDVFFITNTKYAGIADLINEDAYVFNAAYFDKWGIEPMGYFRMCQEKTNLSDADIYDITGEYLSNPDAYVMALNQFGMYIEEVIDYRTDAAEVELIKLVYDTDRQNNCYQGSEEICIAGTSEGNVFRFIGGVSQYAGESEERMIITVEQPDGTNQIVEVAVKPSVELYEIPLGNIAKDSVLRIKVYRGNDDTIDNTSYYYILNPKIVSSSIEAAESSAVW